MVRQHIYILNKDFDIYVVSRSRVDKSEDFSKLLPFCNNDSICFLDQGRVGLGVGIIV